MLRWWFTWAVVGVVIAVGVIAGVDALRSSDQPASTRPSATTTTAENPASTLQPPPPFADIGPYEEVTGISVNPHSR
jgi:hypothetical protein